MISSYLVKVFTCGAAMNGLWLQVAIGVVVGGGVLLGAWHALRVVYWFFCERVPAELTEGGEMQRAADEAIARENALRQQAGQAPLTVSEAQDLRWEVSKAFMVRKYLHQR